jgi:hypothetical protein
MMSLDPDRTVTVYFGDGTRRSFLFPQQSVPDQGLTGKIDDLLDRDYLSIEADGSVMVFPFSCI